MVRLAMTGEQLEWSGPGTALGPNLTMYEFRI
jgi:hypothetical protein